VTASDDDRIAYLAGEAGESLPADDRAALDALRAELSAAVTWEEPPADLEDRVVAAVAQQAGETHPGTHQSRSRPSPARAPVRHRLRSAGGGLSARRRALALSVLSAAAIAGVFAVTGLSDNAPEQQFAMVVLGTSLAPRAHGAATLTKTTSGWRIQLSATGLPHRQGATFYEAWLKNAAGTLVPVGTFNDARQVTLWSGVPVTKFRNLTVTLQPANGNPVSSGRRVMIGTIR
jgi:Anti-sigma-K factor rskA